MTRLAPHGHLADEERSLTRSSTNICSLIFRHAARSDDLRWPGCVTDPVRDEELSAVNRRVGRSAQVQNLHALGTCAQMASHAGFFLDAVREYGMTCGAADARRQLRAVSDLLRSFFASAGYDGLPGLLLYHNWCLTDRSEYARYGVALECEWRGAFKWSRGGGGGARLFFDPAGHRSIPVNGRSLRWTAGPRYDDDARDWGPCRVPYEQTARRGRRCLSAVHCEHLALAPRGDEAARMLRRFEFPYQHGRSYDWLGRSMTIVAFAVVRAARLWPLRIEGGEVTRAVEESLVVLLDGASGAVARVSTKHQLFDSVSAATRPEEHPYWSLLKQLDGVS